jgi:hypothetical protein
LKGRRFLLKATMGIIAKEDPGLLLELNAFLSLLAQFAIYFPSGYLLANYKIKNVPFVIKLPVFISLGLITDTIILSIIGTVYIGNGTLVALAAISYGILIFRLSRSSSPSDGSYTKLKYYGILERVAHILFNFKPILNSLRSVQVVVAAIVFLLVIIHFSMVVGFMQWPPGLDAINSGLLTSLLVHTHRLQTTISPIAPSQPWFEPFGLHVIAANTAFVYGIFPGEALLIVATVITILILLMVYSIIFILTKSTAFSILGLIAGFYIYPATSDIRFLEKWLIGYYYNTPYPNLYGYLALLLFMTCWIVIFDDDKRKQTKVRVTRLVSLIGIGLSYTPFIILPSVYIFISYLMKLKGSKFLHFLAKINDSRKNQKFPIQMLSRNGFVTLLIIGVISILVVEIILSSSYLNEKLGGFFKLIERIHANSYYYTAVVLTPNFLTNFTGIWTVIASASAILSLVRRNRSKLSIFFLLFSSAILVSSVGGKIVNDYIWFLLHGRLFAFLILLDWIMMSTYLSDLVCWIMNKSSQTVDKKYFSHFVIARAFRTTIAIALISIFFLPSLVSHGTLEQAEHWDWIFGSAHFKNDYNLLAWMSNNINMSDLIMTDYTYTSKSIHSFSLKNTTHNPFPHSQTEIERDKNNAVAWDRLTLLRSFVNRYDVKYILLDSEPLHRLPPEVGGDDVYSNRVFDTDQYKEIFSHMPFLKLIKEFDSAAVYEVMK